MPPPLHSARYRRYRTGQPRKTDCGVQNIQYHSPTFTSSIPEPRAAEAAAAAKKNVGYNLPIPSIDNIRQGFLERRHRDRGGVRAVGLARVCNAAEGLWAVDLTCHTGLSKTQSEAGLRLRCVLTSFPCPLNACNVGVLS